MHVDKSEREKNVRILEVKQANLSDEKKKIIGEIVREYFSLPHRLWSSCVPFRYA